MVPVTRFAIECRKFIGGSVLKKVLAVLFSMFVVSAEAADWFEEIKSGGDDAALHQTLYEMPKGGDLHHHLSGSIFSEDWYELALASEAHGYRYYTKVKINNCQEHGTPGFNQYLIHYQNLSEVNWNKLDACERGEYMPLSELSDSQFKQWSDALRLHESHEGRNEFFGKHWERLGDLLSDPYIMIGILLKNFEHFADEGLIYAEPQVSVVGWVQPDGTGIHPMEAAEMLRQALKTKPFIDTGMNSRFQTSILRFRPQAEDHLRMAYGFVSANEHWVAVNMVGREDDDKGYPLRFLPTLRALRQQHNNVRLSIHGGEVDEPNDHVRDTLLLGADRIGHGVNLITDPDTMRLMRHGPYLVEINLISNLLLEYVTDYNQHPFPEYLRLGIPVALSTDDRGMWDSTMTDEFFVGVKEFNLSWDEVKWLSTNSLKYAFLPESEKNELLEKYQKNINQFEKKLERRGLSALNGKSSPKRGFICRRYQLCAS